MRKILLLILVAQQDVYMRNYIYLKDHYMRVINKHHLPVEVIGYIGGSNCLWYEPSANIMHLPVADDNICEKFRLINEVVFNHIDFDVVIKTNASTVINLRLLNQLIQSNRFDLTYQYGASTAYSFLSDGDWYFNYFQGFFNIYSKFNIPRFLNNWKEHKSTIYKLDSNIPDGTDEDPYMYTSDDTVMGLSMSKANIPLHCIGPDYELFISHNASRWTGRTPDITNAGDFAGTSLVLCKSGDGILTNPMYARPIEERQFYEPPIIHLMSSIYEGAIITDEIIEKFIAHNTNYDEPLTVKVSTRTNKRS